MRTPVRAPARMTVADFLELVNWISGEPVLNIVEPYRLRILRDALDTWDGDRIKFNLIVCGRGKKNSSRPIWSSPPSSRSSPMTRSTATTS